MRVSGAPVGILALVVLSACGGGDAGEDAQPPDQDAVTTSTAQTPSGAPSSARATSGTPSTRPPETTAPARPRVAGTVATDLEVPWGLDFLPDGRALVTQRARGTISVVDGPTVREVGRIDATYPTSEGGLLGLAVSPDFAEDQRLFVYVSTAEDNRVLAMRFDGETIRDVQPILTGIPVGQIHDGGQLQFGPDGFLYVSTGETGAEELAQDPDSLGGKILRITAVGEPAPGNPDPGSPVWTLGHRNVQGLAFDARGRLWASEFGSDTWDELNLIRPGDNYGWPVVEGKAKREGYVDPLVEWDPDDASPSSIAYADGSIWMAALNGERLWQIPLVGDGVGKPVGHFVGDYGRLRRVVTAPDGSLWLTTSNRDGRGDPRPGDDRILRITLH